MIDRKTRWVLSLLRLLFAFFLVLGQVVFAATTPTSVSAQNTNSDEILDELIVGLTSEGHNEAADVHNRGGGTLKRQAGLAPVQVVTVARNLAPSAQAAYARDRRVRFVEHNVRVRLAAVPTDPSFAQQWSLNRIAAPIAWDTSNGSAKVKIAIVDTGVDPNHPDLVGQIAATANFSTASDSIDRNGHGTHVAGTIAALTNNQLGIAGVAPGSKLLIARALDDQGIGTYADLIESIDWAVGQGARVINMSLAGNTPSRALADAVASAQSKGVVIVAAAGNTASSNPTYPASLPGVISVAATDQSDQLSSSSTFGPWVSLAAPGVGIYSTAPGNRYAYLSGSSMAAAHVSASAALAMSASPQMRGNEVGAVLMDSADRVGWSGVGFQSGRLNAAAAVSLGQRRSSGQPPLRPAVDLDSWRAIGSGQLVGGDYRFFTVNLAGQKDDNISGSFSYIDRAKNIRFRSQTIESVSIANGVATVVGTGQVNTLTSPFRFKAVITDRNEAAPGKISFDLNGAKVIGYHQNAAIMGRVRVVGQKLATGPQTATPASSNALRSTPDTGIVRAAAVTLAATPSTTGGNGSVQVTWAGIGSPTTTDWIGQFATVASNTNYITWRYAGCTQSPTQALAAGTCWISMPASDGTYEYRLFANNSSTILATSNIVTVSGPTATVTPTVTVTPTASRTPTASNTPTRTLTPTSTATSSVTATPTITPGGPTIAASPGSTGGGGFVTVNWANIQGAAAMDWMTLAVVGSANNSFVSWQFVNCTVTATIAFANGSCGFVVPAINGSYEFRLFSNNGYTRIATSNVVTVSGSTATATPTATATRTATATSSATITPGGPVIAVAPGNTGGGGYVTANWANIPGATAMDWMTLALVGSANNSFVSWQFVNCALTATIAIANGSCGVTMPVTDGSYEVRLFTNNSYTRIATSNPITVAGPTATATQTATATRTASVTATRTRTPTSTVTPTPTVSSTITLTPGGATMSAAPSSTGGGGIVTVTWANIQGSTAMDWITLALVGSANNSFVAWQFVNCSPTATIAIANGSCGISMPTVNGSYEFRLFTNNTYTRIATSNTVTVGGPTATSTPTVTVTSTPTVTLTRTATPTVTITPGGPTMSAAPGFTGGGGIVTVNWTNIPSPTSMDWMIIAVVGSANSSFVTWQFVNCSTTATTAIANGSCAFAMPATNGSYEFRLLANNSYTLLATSGVVTVAGDPATDTPTSTVTPTRTQSPTSTATSTATTTPTVTITPGGPTIAAAPTATGGGGLVTVNWANIPGATSMDWIALSLVGSGNSSFVSWQFVNCSATATIAFAAGSCNVSMPATDGNYEFRLFSNNGFTRVATSNSVTVAGPSATSTPTRTLTPTTTPTFTSTTTSTPTITPGGPTMAAAPTGTGGGGLASVTWANIPSAMPMDWIALALVGSANNSFVSWQFVNCTVTATSAFANGTCSISMPATDGSYEFRLFSNNSYTRVATSNIVTVSGPTATMTPTVTRTPTIGPSHTHTTTPTRTVTPTITQTSTVTQTATITNTPGPTMTHTITATSSATPTRTRTMTATTTPTVVITFTTTRTPTITSTPSPTSTFTTTPTVTATPVSGDTFVRADSATSLGTSPSGQSWETDGTVWGICSNAACSNTAGGSSYARVNAGMTNQLVRVTIGGVASPYSGQVGLIAQTTADWNTNLLWVGTDTNGLIEVWTLTSGTWNGPIASGASGANYALARVLEANVNGTTLTVRMNGAIVSGLSAMAVPSAPVSASYAGMYIDTTGASWPTVIDFYVNSAN